MIDQIQELVRKNLPAEVGDQLKSVLAKAQQDSKRVDELTDLLAAKSRECDTMRKQLQEHGELDKKKQDVEAQLGALSEKLLKSELMDLKVSAAEQRAKDLKEIVALVFQNNRFKYVQNGTETIVNPTGGYTTPGPFSRSVEGEG